MKFYKSLVKTMFKTFPKFSVLVNWVHSHAIPVDLYVSPTLYIDTEHWEEHPGMVMDKIYHVFLCVQKATIYSRHKPVIIQFPSQEEATRFTQVYPGSLISS